MQRITIVGLGLIGASIGMALKKANLKGMEIVGHDRDGEAAGRARRRGAVDRTDWNLISAVREANMIVIATPVMGVRDTFAVIAPHLAEDCVLTDTASTKAHVMLWADELLPPHVSFIGGHPMAGKEVSGADGADPDLFSGCTYCLIPSPKAAPKAVEWVIGLVNILGAKPLFLDATEHDGLAAGISHLPLILSMALVSATTGGNSWREMSKLAASGFRDVSRLASGNPEMSRDICLTNQDSIVRWIDRFIDELGRYRKLVSEGGDGLLAEFQRVWEAREKWLYSLQGVEETGRPPIPSSRELLGDVFLGDSLRRAVEPRQIPPREKPS